YLPSDPFFFMTPLLPISRLFPYTTLFRSLVMLEAVHERGRRGLGRAGEKHGGARHPNRGLFFEHVHEIVERDFLAPGNLARRSRSEEHTSELHSLTNIVCRLLLEKKKYHY